MRTTTFALAGLLTLSLAACGRAAAEPPSAAPSPRFTFTPESNCQGYYALSFDDGPTGMTQDYLNALRAANAPATFFVNGYRIKDHPGYIEKMAADGHQVGNHTEDHENLNDLAATPPAFNAQIDSVQSEVTSVGAPAPTLFRPPYGAATPAVRQQIEAKGFLVTMWSVDTKDWEPTATAESILAKTAQTGNGDILLMHEDKPTTLGVIPRVVSQLRAKGLCPGKIVKSPTERPTDQEGRTMNAMAVKP